MTDACALCGHELEVLDVAWRGLATDVARVAAANYCGDRFAVHGACDRLCRQLAEADPRHAEAVATALRRRLVAIELGVAR